MAFCLSLAQIENLRIQGKEKVALQQAQELLCLRELVLGILMLKFTLQAEINKRPSGPVFGQGKISRHGPLLQKRKKIRSS